MDRPVYDLKQRTYAFALDVVRLLENLPRDYVAQTLGKQLLRSATSVGANVIEAQASSSRKDFGNFYRYALKSANESKFWFGLLRDSRKVSPHEVESLFDEVSQLAKILASCLLTLQARKPF